MVKITSYLKKLIWHGRKVKMLNEIYEI